MVAVVALVADVDAAGKSGHDYPPQKRILDALDGMPLAPSIVIISGRADRGLHCYWLLAVPFVIHADEDRQRIKSVSQRWQALLRDKLQPFELDSTYDLVRVLRPVGTHNHKYGTVVRPLDFHPERRYSLEQIESLLPPPPEPPCPIAYPPTSHLDAESTTERARRERRQDAAGDPSPKGRNASAVLARQRPARARVRPRAPNRPCPCCANGTQHAGRH